MLRLTQMAAGGFLAVAVLLVSWLAAVGQSGPKPADPQATAADAKLQELIKTVDDAAKQLQDAVAKGDRTGIEAATRRLAETRKALEDARKGAGAAKVPDPANPLVPDLTAKLKGLGRLGKGMDNNRLGASLEVPSETLISQLGLTKGQGLVVGPIRADSAAAKAGVQAGDILLEFAGKPVASDPAAFAKALAEIKPNDTVAALVLRKGQKTAIKAITVPEAAPADDSPLANLAQLPLRIAGPGGKGQVLVMGKTDGFIAMHRDGKLMILVNAESMDLKTLDELNIIIRDGDVMDNFDDVNDVPAQFQPIVKLMVENGIKRMMAEAKKP